MYSLKEFLWYFEIVEGGQLRVFTDTITDTYRHLSAHKSKFEHLFEKQHPTQYVVDGAYSMYTEVGYLNLFQ